MNKIDNEFLIEIVKEIKEEIEEFNPNIKRSFLFRIYHKLPGILRRNIVIPILANKQKKCDFFYSSGLSKKRSIEFFEYICKNKENLDFDLTQFNEKDRESLIKYIRNIFLITFVDKIRKDMLFNKEDFEIIKRYNSLAKTIKYRNNAYEFSYNRKRYVLPTAKIDIPVFYHSYKIDEIPCNVLKKIQGKIFIDCGAFIGDTSLILNKFNPGKIYAFEPVKENYDNMLKTIRQNELRNVIPVKMGVGDKETRLKIKSRDILSSIDEQGDEEIKVTTIDNFSEKNNLEVGLIKMDIEGYELEAIKGSKKTIKKYKPVLLISLYHTAKDFFCIPKLLKKWIPKYKYRFITINHQHPINDRILIAYISTNT